MHQCCEAADWLLIGSFTDQCPSALIFEYPTSPGAPSFSTMLSLVKGPSQVVESPVVQVSGTHSVVRVTKGRVSALAFVRSSDPKQLKLQTLRDDDESTVESLQHSTKEQEIVPTNPEIVLIFLDRWLDVLQDYFALSTLTIEANYDIMCNLMQELVQAGAPYITDINALKEYVPFKSTWSSRILSTTNQLAKSYSAHQQVETMSNGIQRNVPWRRPNVKYTQNELFVDITERINVVLSPRHHRQKKTLLKGQYQQQQQQQYTQELFTKMAVLEGQVDFTSHLSGVPDVVINFNLNGHRLENPSFHRCVRLDRWLNNGDTVSFIPPDGKSTLMQYTLDLDQYSSSKAHRNYGVVIPEFRQGLGVKKNEFEIGVKLNMLRNVSKVDNLKITISTETGATVKILRLSHGDLQTKSQGTFEWVFDTEMSLGTNALLRGVVELPDSNPKSKEQEDDDSVLPIPHWPKTIALDYTMKGALPSGIRVSSVKVSGLNVNPYKGVKYVTSVGDFVIR